MIEILTSQIIFDQYRETCRENSIHTEQIPYTNSENHFSARFPGLGE